MHIDIGLYPGDCPAVISARDDIVPTYNPKVPVKPKRLVPAKYENPETSGLTRTDKDGSNTRDFELTD